MRKKGFAKQLILINRDLQFRYTRIALFIGLISTILCTVVILAPLYQFEILRIPKFLPMPILSAMVLALVINMGCVVMMMIIITHRIAGPIFALSREFAEVSQGIFGRKLYSRKADDLQYLVRSFNEMSLCLKNITYDDLEMVTNMHESASKLHLKIGELAANEVKKSHSSGSGAGKDGGDGVETPAVGTELKTLEILTEHIQSLLAQLASELRDRIHDPEDAKKEKVEKESKGDENDKDDEDNKADKADKADKDNKEGSW